MQRKSSPRINKAYKIKRINLVDVSHLVGCPHASRLRHPFSGVDTCVNPDGRTLVSSGAELNTVTDVELDSTDRRLV